MNKKWPPKRIPHLINEHQTRLHNHWRKSFIGWVPPPHLKPEQVIWCLMVHCVSEERPTQCCVSCVTGPEPRSGSTSSSACRVVLMGDCVWTEEHLTSAPRTTRGAQLKKRGGPQSGGADCTLTFWKKSSPPLTLPSEAARVRQRRRKVNPWKKQMAPNHSKTVSSTLRAGSLLDVLSDAVTRLWPSARVNGNVGVNEVSYRRHLHLTSWKGLHTFDSRPVGVLRTSPFVVRTASSNF